MRFHQPCCWQIFVLLLPLVIGCAGYQFGAKTMYCSDIQTIHVSMFESDSYRRNLGEWLTEAVVKEIEQRTPYKIVSSSHADSILSGRITSDTKQRITRNRFDEPRDIEVAFYVQINWVDNRGGRLVNDTLVPIPALLTSLRSDSDLIPEAGQSIATSQQDAIRKLAAKIVSQMEVPW